MCVDPRHTFSLTAYAKVIVINAFSVRDQPSRQYSLNSFIILFLLWVSAHRSLTDKNFFSSQPVHLKVISTTILDRIEWNGKPPSQIKINQGRNPAKAQTGHFFHPWGVGVGG